MPPQKKDALDKYRARIDAIDDQILDLLVKRSHVVREVGTLKGLRHSRKSIIRPGREAAMIRRVMAKSEGRLSKAAVGQMWRMIISSAINIEEDAHISTLAMPGNRECYWLAREHFGAFTPITRRPTLIEVVQDVLALRATVGVLPLWDETSPHAWWARVLEEDADPPRIFARLPFIQRALSDRPPLVAIGYIEPEPTGEDESLWVIRADETVSLSAIENLLDSLGIQHAIQGKCRVYGTPTMHYFLLNTPGFVDQNSKAMKLFAERATTDLARGGISVTASWLGAYAIPIVLG